eukprot:CAMPEP_0184496682 /NCGR_PEP_ID=MMETSP0113_2-20130426/34619_1 /TAXON_ID=91329 /ORGANISM="Norrisiella sphaerica, Strain BC52" /LENGTH=63 /DNA_ID=CAMNT_0026883421 /DNA_START=95 /DNA_END=283 /DNA_ORIENTATION=+
MSGFGGIGVNDPSVGTPCAVVFAEMFQFEISTSSDDSSGMVVHRSTRTIDENHGLIKGLVENC